MVAHVYIHTVLKKKADSATSQTSKRIEKYMGDFKVGDEVLWKNKGKAGRLIQR